MTSKFPLFSFVITTYNAEKYILETLTSISKIPSSIPYEIVIIDDGSTDSTYSLCEDYSKHNEGIVLHKAGRVFRAKALNVAVEKARGKYIAINDADDISFPNRIVDSVAALELSDDIVLVATECTITHDLPRKRRLSYAERINDQKSIVARSATSELIAPQDLYRKNIIVHSTVTFKKSAWVKSGGYNESLSSCIDYDFYFRVMKFGKILKIGSITVDHYFNPDTFFKKDRGLDFVFDYFKTKLFARRNFRIPLFYILSDLKIFVYLAASILLKAKSIRSS